MIIVFLVALLYGVGIIGSIGLLIYTIVKRKKEKKIEEEKHKDYKNY